MHSKSASEQYLAYLSYVEGVAMNKKRGHAAAAMMRTTIVPVSVMNLNFREFEFSRIYIISSVKL
jgi:hypothetical protein